MTVLHKPLALVAVFVGVFLVSVKQIGAQSSTLTAFYTAHVVSMAPMWIANETGLFKKHGADVRLVYIGSGPIGISINPSPDYAMVARAFEGYGEKVEDPGEVRAALQRGLKAVAGGQVALIDVRLAKAAETNERPDRAN